jgi:hypothetical protein
MPTSALLVYNVVTDYGASNADGADATVLINQAITDAAAGTANGDGGIVFLPVGTYRIGKDGSGNPLSIALKSNVRIVGEAAQNGTGVVLKPCHGADCETAVNQNEAAHVPVFNYVHAGSPITGWSIENVAIDFSRCRSGSAPSAFPGDVGINISGCFLYDIENVSVSYGYYAYKASQTTHSSITRDCYMGTVRKLYSKECRNGIKHAFGTTMIFDSCWVNANQGTEDPPDSAYWSRGWDLETIYGVTLTSCVLEKWKSGDSPAFGFRADSCRGLVIDGMDVESNETNGGNLFELNNCEVSFNAFRTKTNKIQCANGAVSALIRANGCSFSMQGSAMGGSPNSAEYDTANLGNGSSEAVVLRLTSENTPVMAAAVMGCRIGAPAAGGSWSGTATALKDETGSTSRVTVLGTAGIDNRLPRTIYGEYLDLDYGPDVARSYRVLVAGTERVKLYGTGNNTNHGGRQQLIDGGVIGAGLRIGTSGDPGYALHLTSDSAAKPSTSTWTVTSDERTKENLRPFHTGLDVLRQVVLQTWEYNGLGDTPSGQTASGVIAQDMQPILPDAVVTTRLKHHVGDSDQAEYLGVNYHLLFLSALNAIKELDERVAALENAP